MFLTFSTKSKKTTVPELRIFCFKLSYDSSALCTPSDRRQNRKPCQRYRMSHSYHKTLSQLVQSYCFCLLKCSFIYWTTKTVKTITIPQQQRNAVKLKMAKILFMLPFYAERGKQRGLSNTNAIKDSGHQNQWMSTLY